MKTGLIIAACAAGAGLLLAIILVFWGIGTYNSEATLLNQYHSKVTANEAIFDNTWKKIAQSAQVTDAQKAALKEIFTSYASARTGNSDGGSLMKWTQEAIPNVDTSVYRNLQNIITGARDEWTANQVALVDVAREYNLALATFPSGPFLRLFGFVHVDAQIVTSSRTEGAFKTGRDDDTSLGLSH